LEKLDKGLISLNGTVLNSDNIFVKPQRRKISYVFQDFPLFPHLTVYNNLIFNLNSAFKKNIDDLVGVTGIKTLLNRYPYQLSGGERQRVCIVRAIIREPELLLLDEPFSNLDKNIKKSIIDHVESILQQKKITTILVTHDINNILNISDKILVFKGGVLQQYDSPQNMYCHPSNCYCAELLGDLNEINFQGKRHYIRPEHVKIVEKSKYKINIIKSLYQGKDYKVKATHNQNEFHFYSKEYYEPKTTLHFDFDSKKLFFFNKKCESYFT
jgi:iron(III) transport system ATP-binding protein